jgi:hypothetical protein
VVTKTSIVQQQLDIILRHNTLQEALYSKLSAEYGADAVGTERPNGAGARIDVVVRMASGFWFYEIKTAASARACIREGLAQLLDYSLWPGAQEAERLIIVGEAELDHFSEQFLETLRTRFALPIYYEHLDVEAVPT